ncbi:helix-turn-helix domain-containing protein [Streptomyces sp. NPDC088350]|uniref:AraC-like ligand-binding domain-containing protein n=1 Tax=Streptomyces sp. NPDC088350 TaxID=3365854 RepID=UPI00382EDD33
MPPDASVHDEESVPGRVYTTDSLPVQHRRAYWREALSRTFGAVTMNVPDEVYSGTIRTSPLGRLQTITVDGDSLYALRTNRLVAQGREEECVVVKLLDRGTARLTQDGREADLRPGDIFVYDMARPVRLDLPRSFRTKAVVLPRDVLGLSESDLTRITASPVRPDSPLGGLLSPFLTGLVDTAAAYPPRIGELMARNVVDLLSVLVDEQLGRTIADTRRADRALLLRIQAFVDQHLADPDLGPKVIARVHHISLRYLHKLFESEDVTVNRWIQRRRLEGSRRELARRDAASRSVAAVAHRWGFTSAAHFSRSFRAAYGMTPSEWRGAQNSVQGTPAATGPPPPEKAESDSSPSHVPCVLRQSAHTVEF